MNMRTVWHHPNYSIIKVGQKTEESPADLKSFAISLVKDHLLTPVKTSQGII